MKLEDKQLLLQDLCGRLPYGVKCQFEDTIRIIDGESSPFYDYVLSAHHLELFMRHNNFYIKPYLRPMSSMTEKEKKEYIEYAGYEIEESVNGRHYECYLKDFCGTPDNPSVNPNGVDWLNKKMFDFRGLIPEGLAEIAPEGMYELNYLPSQNESDSMIDNTTKITVGCKIRSKTKPIEILSIISDDCHGDEFECSNGTVLSLKQIEKYYELIK